MTYPWKGASVTRLLPTPESVELLAMVEEFGADLLATQVDDAEAQSRFPREVFTIMGDLGLLGLPFDEEYGGGQQPYEVVLQSLEEVARAWLSVGVSLSVHYLSCFAVANFGTQEQRAQWLPDMVGCSAPTACPSRTRDPMPPRWPPGRPPSTADSG